MTLYEKFGVGCFGLFGIVFFLGIIIELIKINIFYGVLFLLGLIFLIAFGIKIFEILKKLLIIKYLCVLASLIFLAFMINMFVNNWFNSIAYLCTFLFVMSLLGVLRNKFANTNFVEADEFNKLINNYDWDNAIELLKNSIDNPKNKPYTEQILMNLLPILMYKKYYKDTIDYINTKSKNADTYCFLLYACLIKSNKIEEADKYKEEILKKYSKNAQWKTIGFTQYCSIFKYIESKEYDKALSLLENNLDLNITGINMLYYKIYKATGDKNKAIASLKKDIASKENLYKLLSVDELIEYLKNN